MKTLSEPTSGESNSFLVKKDSRSEARAGKFNTDHGVVETPVFMPVGTYGTVKTLTPAELEDCKTQIILGNTYHLYLRPGLDVIKGAGGLHNFISWSKPILSDSGGYQVFSLSHLGKITDKEVSFRSHIDGSLHRLSPEISIDIQNVLGSDIVMVLDECTPFPCKYEVAKKSLQRTHEWEKRSKDHFEKLSTLYGNRQFLFGIIQGSIYPDLRQESIKELKKMNFDGYAIGGLAVGEPKKQMFELLKGITEQLPENKPRYLMGIGKPEDIIHAIELGVDMFDCVLPSRNARNGTLYTWNGRIILKQSRYRMDYSPPDENCSCYTCRNFSRAFLRHLFMNGEMTGLRLNTLHNVHFFLELLEHVRDAIKNGNFSKWRDQFFSHYPVEPDHWKENRFRREERRKKHLEENERIFGKRNRSPQRSQSTQKKIRKS